MRWLALASLAASCAPDPGVEITILHVNDLHARLLPDSDGRGGFAHVATVLAREREDAPAHLTLHGGDMVQGTPVSTLFQGVPIFAVANGLGIDVHCLGNHEFDYGWERVAEYVDVSAFDTVSANVLDDHGNPIVDPYVVRQVGALRVAVVGAMTEDLSGLVAPSDLGPWSATPIVPTLRPVVEDAAAASDMVVVLGHLSGGDAEAILRQLPQVAVVVQGHPHRAWEEALEVDGRLAVNASGYGRDVGRLRLRYDPGAGRILGYEWDVLPVIAKNVPANRRVAELVAEWEGRAAEIVDIPIGRATRMLGEDALMRLVRASMRAGTGADLAYYNRGGIRDILPEGELLARHVWNVLPFDNAVVATSLLGREIVALQETVMSDAPIGGYETLDPDRRYRLVTSDFSAEHWQARGVELDWTDTGLQMRDLLLGWIEARGTVPEPDSDP